MNRSLPVKWWQRPQHWRPTVTADGQLALYAQIMWSLWCLTYPAVDDELLRRTLQPSADAAERAA